LWRPTHAIFIGGSASAHDGLHVDSFEVRLMPKISSLGTTTALAALLLTGTAFAQTTAPAPKDAAKTETTAPTPEEKKARSAASLECSKQADAKSLHGKARKKFRRECLKEAADKSAGSK
jgi:psiF repeat